MKESDWLVLNMTDTFQTFFWKGPPISTHLSVGSFPGGYVKYILLICETCHLACLVSQNLSSDIKKLTIIKADSCIYSSVDSVLVAALMLIPANLKVLV